MRVRAWLMPPLAHCRQGVHIGLRAPCVLGILLHALAFTGHGLFKGTYGVNAINMAVVCGGQEQKVEATLSRLLDDCVLHPQLAQGGQHPPARSQGGPRMQSLSCASSRTQRRRRKRQPRKKKW
jgi:hypothetical protein